MALTKRDFSEFQMSIQIIKIAQVAFCWRGTIPP